MDEHVISPFAVTALGAIFAGVAAGTLAVALDSVYGTVLGLAVAMLFLIQFGYGFGTLDREAYFGARTRSGVATDTALLVAGAAIAGALAATAVGWLDLPNGIAAGVATGAAFGGGGAAFLWRTGEFHGEVDVVLGESGGEA